MIIMQSYIIYKCYMQTFTSSLINVSFQPNFLTQNEADELLSFCNNDVHWRNLDRRVTTMFGNEGWFI